MAEYDDERDVQDPDGVLDGTENRAVDDVTCRADDEHVAESLVEDDLGRDT